MSPSTLPPVGSGAGARGAVTLSRGYWRLLKYSQRPKVCRAIPFLHVRPDVPSLAESTGTAGVGAGSHPSQARLLWSPSHGCWGEAPLFSVAPSPTLVWSVGAGEALAVVWLQGRVTTRQSDCKIKLRGAGFLCVLLLKRLLRGLESYVQNGRLCKELMVMGEGWGSRLLGSLEWTCTRCCI